MEIHTKSFKDWMLKVLHLRMRYGGWELVMLPDTYKFIAELRRGEERVYVGVVMRDTNRGSLFMPVERDGRLVSGREVMRESGLRR